MFKVRHEAFEHYFRFMEERMQIFWRRYKNEPGPWTSDPILNNYKFTNVYRASDRVSQYLIKNIIAKAESSLTAEDILLNIILFKVFNRIDTWEHVKKYYPLITVENFCADKLGRLLTKRKQDSPIFNAAYIMTGSSNNYSSLRYKHERWLQMIRSEMINGKKLKLITKSKSLGGVYEILRSCTFIGPFLAYQYAIDMNYSDVIDFDENSFVKAGIGSQRGINKCFSGLNGHSYEDAIRYTYDHLDFYRERYGTSFENLFGRTPKLIDLQNCFCETDKYLREKLPRLHVGNKRIKQRFNSILQPIEYMYPSKWKLDCDVMDISMGAQKA